MPEPHESLIDRQIRLAAERGDFDDLPGAGRPLPGLDEPDDGLWWVRGYLRREGLSTEALLPPSVQLRKEIEALAGTLRDLPTERAVRDVVADLNLRIVEFLRAPTGPRLRIGRVDADEAVGRWAADRTDRGITARDDEAAAEPASVACGQPSRPRWWRRRR